MSKECGCKLKTEITVANPTEEKINQPDYKFYVYSFVQNKILTGWETKNDAIDGAAELNPDLGRLGVYSKPYITNKLMLDPDNNKNWGKDHVNEAQEEGGPGFYDTSKSNISIYPLENTLEEMIAALDNLDNYGKFLSNLRNTKIGLENALEAHFGPTHPVKKRTLEKKRGEPFPLKTKQSINDFIKSFSTKSNILTYDIENETLVFPNNENPTKEMTKKIIATVMKNAGIKYKLEDKEIQETLSETLLKHIVFKNSIREGIKKIMGKEIIPGGLAKGKTLTDIAKHHSCSEKDLQSQLDKGIKVEMEHTTSKATAKEISMDHLWEDPKYYNKLSKIDEEEEPKSDKLFKIEPKLAFKIYDILDKGCPEFKEKFPLATTFFYFLNSNL